MHPPAALQRSAPWHPCEGVQRIAQLCVGKQTKPLAQSEADWQLCSDVELLLLTTPEPEDVQRVSIAARGIANTSAQRNLKLTSTIRTIRGGLQPMRHLHAWRTQDFLHSCVADTSTPCGARTLHLLGGPPACRSET
jgi:hypothetical protein